MSLVYIMIALFFYHEKVIDLCMDIHLVVRYEVFGVCLLDVKIIQEAHSKL